MKVKNIMLRDEILKCIEHNRIKLKIKKCYFEIEPVRITKTSGGGIVKFAYGPLPNMEDWKIIRGKEG